MSNQYYDNKLIMITGATSGLGLEMALLAKSYNSEVLVHGRNIEKILSFFPGITDSEYVICNLENADEWVKVENAIARFKPNILILNAGYNCSKKLVSEYTDIEINHMININYLSNIFFSRTYDNTLREINVESFVMDEPKTVFFAASMLRGIFHDYLAGFVGKQIIHHPFRSNYLSTDICVPESENIIVEESLKYYIAILLACASLESNTEKRIKKYNDNIDKTRKAIKKGVISFTNASCFDDVARHEAFTNIRNADINVGNSNTEKIVDLIFSAVTSVISFFVFKNWELSLLWGGANCAVNRIPSGIVKITAQTDLNLNKLIELGGGRLLPNWGQLKLSSNNTANKT